MKRIVWKPFWDYRKEEAWLNAMAAKGLSLSDYSWCRYAFEETEPGAYRYRIELLDFLPTHPEGEAYLRFLENAGVEVVATYLRWAYLRQPAAAGGFELFSDTGSRLAQAKKVMTLYIALMVAEFSAGLANLTLGLALSGQTHAGTNLIVAVPCLLLGFGFLFGLALPQRSRIRRLEDEKRIRE